MDHKLLAGLAMCQLIGLGCCIATDGDRKSDASADVAMESGPDEKGVSDDLDTQETGWILDKKMSELEYLKNKVIYPFTALKSPSYGGGGGGVYTGYGGATPGVSYGGGVSSGFSAGASFNPSLSYSASFNPGISYGTNFNSGYSSGGGSSGYYPGYKKQIPFIGATSYASSYPIQNKFNFYQKFNPISFKQSLLSSVPSKPWYGSSSNGGYTPSSGASYAPYCNYYVYTPSSSFVQPAPVYTSGTPLSTYYSTTGPTQTYGGAKSAYLGGSAQLSFQSSPPSPVLQVPQTQLRDGTSSWTPSSIPSFSQTSLPATGSLPSSYPKPPTSIPGSSSYPTLPANFPSPPNSWTSSSANYPTPSPPQAALPQAPFSWSYQGPPSFSYPNQFLGPGRSQYIVVPQGSGSSFSNQAGAVPQEVAITPAPPQVRGQLVLPGTVGYPGAIYFSNGQSSARDSSDQPSESQPSATSETDESTGAQPESSESSTASSPPPQSSNSTASTPQTTPVLTTYYTSNTIDQTRVPLVVYVQPSSGGYYSSPAGYGYPSYYLAPLPPAHANQLVTPSAPC